MGEEGLEEERKIENWRGGLEVTFIIGLLEVGLSQWLCAVWLVGKGPHDHRRSVLVSLNELMHHSNMVVESLVSKVLWTV